MNDCQRCERGAADWGDQAFKCDECRIIEQRDKIERLQAELDDTGDTLQMHQTSGDYEAGRRLGEKAATKKIEEQRDEIGQLQTTLDAAKRLLADALKTLPGGGRVRWGWSGEGETMGHYLDGRFIGESLEDVIAAAAGGDDG